MADWIKITKDVDSGVSGTGFLVEPGFLVNPFLSTPTGSAWTKITKDTIGLWSKLEKET
jgi:hypothetical protein